MEAADCDLEKLLDDLGRHGGCEATGRPQSTTEKEGRRRWERKNKQDEVRNIKSEITIFMFHCSLMALTC